MKIIIVIVSILIAQVAGVIGSVFTTPNIEGWYAILVKPSWNPPNWIFGPVWITLYILMGIAASLVWFKRNLPGAKIALWLYGTQLVFNSLWSILFFGLKNPGLAFAEIIVLFILILATTVFFWRIKLLAGALMIPYVMWVLFAVYLNYTIWQLN